MALRAFLPFAFAACVVACLSAPPEPEYGAPGAIDNRNPDDRTGGGAGGTAGTATACATAADFAKDDDANCAVKFSTDIWPKLKNDGAWRCSTTGCHVSAIPPNVVVPMDSAGGTFEVLRAMKTKGTQNPYVNPCSKDPAASAFLANLKGELGTKMPVATTGVTPPAAADLAQVETWLKCGAPNN